MSVKGPGLSTSGLSLNHFIEMHICTNVHLYRNDKWPFNRTCNLFNNENMYLLSKKD